MIGRADWLTTITSYSSVYWITGPTEFQLQIRVEIGRGMYKLVVFAFYWKKDDCVNREVNRRLICLTTSVIRKRSNALPFAFTCVVICDGQTKGEQLRPKLDKPASASINACTTSAPYNLPAVPVWGTVSRLTFWLKNKSPWVDGNESNRGSVS